MGAVRQKIPGIIHMSEWLRKMLDSKQKMRDELASLPFIEKLKLLDKLRDRSLLIAKSPLRKQLGLSDPREALYDGVESQ